MRMCISYSPAHIKLRILEEDAAFFEFLVKLLGKHRFHSK